MGSRNLPDAPRDAFSKRKRKSKKNGEGTSNPLSSPAKKSKKTKTLIRIPRFIDTKDVEVQKRIVIEVVKVVEVIKVVEVAKGVKVAKVDKLVETSKVYKARVNFDV